MEYRVAFLPGMGVSAHEFSDAWNATRVCAEVAEADTEQTRGPLLGPEMIDQVLVVLTNVAVGVASSAIYDLIKQVAGAYFGRVRLRLQPQEDGSTMLIVEPEEETTR